MFQKMYHRAIEWIQRTMRSESAISHLLQFFITLLRHWSCDVIVSLIGTIIIALMIAKSYFGFWLVFCCIFYALLLIGSTVARYYDAEQQRVRTQELTALKEQKRLLCAVKDSVILLNSTTSKGLFRTARLVREGNPQLEQIREVFGFQKMAFAICQEVYDRLKETLELHNHWVTVYQRFDSTKKGRKQTTNCKMIAYANATRQEPLSYQVSYIVPKDPKELNSTEYHTQFFASNDVRPRILLNSEAIKKHFKLHEKSKPREERIQQYIGLTSPVCEQGIVFILQVDCDVENGFGKDESEIRELIDNVLMQYVHLLGLYYEMDRLNELSVTHQGV